MPEIVEIIKMAAEYCGYVLIFGAMLVFGIVLFHNLMVH